MTPVNPNFGFAASQPASPPPAQPAGRWQELAGPGGLRLRCWWALPADGPPRAAVLVLPEVFGVNGWVRSVADRLAAAGYAALALPTTARTAPDLELGYDEAGLAEGRRHRDAVTAEQLLADAAAAIAWLQQQPGLEGRPVGCVGFCFGGHLAMLAATLPAVAATCDFYGARVSSVRPGSPAPAPAPTLAVLPEISGHLLCLAGDADPLMPPEELAAIEAALARARAQQAQASQPPLRSQQPLPSQPPSGPADPDHGWPLRRQLVFPGAGHGFMCEARADFHPEAAARGWAAMLDLFARVL